MMPDALAPPPSEAVRHRRALLGLATFGALAAAPLAEAYARSSGSETALASVVVRLTAAGQIGSGFVILAVALAPLAFSAVGRVVLRGMAPAAFATLYALLLVDRKVYALFHFHLNGMVLDLLVTPGGFASLRLTRADLGLATAIGFALLGGAAGAHALLLRRTGRPAASRSERTAWRRALGATTALLFVGQGLYAGADLARRFDVLRAVDAVPAFAGLPARQVLRMTLGDGGVEPDLLVFSRTRPGIGATRYPPNPISFRSGASAPPIVWVVLESWRGDALDPETTPEIARIAESATRFRRHASGGNSTGYGVFSMFYGLHGAYEEAFAAARMPPAMLSALRARGYAFGVFSSAALSSPPLRSTVFARIPDAVHDSFQGDAPTRDRAATDEALAFLRAHVAEPEPFFLFLFLDSSHATYDFPPRAGLFEPYARSLAITEVGSKRRELVWNRYRNALRYEDGLVGEVAAALGPRASETILVIVGDHGEAFGEGGRWFHNSGFAEEQWNVPLVMRAPGLGRGVRDGLSRHIDLPATVLELAGADASSEAVGLGRSLMAPGAAADHAVVCGLRAFAIVEKDGTTTVVPNGAEDWRGLEIHGSHYEAGAGREASPHLSEVLAEMRRFVR
jgi:membrane-anchored protein YejM (alkaline phosphatase superfamily)